MVQRGQTVHAVHVHILARLLYNLAHVQRRTEGMKCDAMTEVC